MNLPDFTASVSAGDPPALSAPLLALWWDRRGEWARAHEAVAHEGGAAAAWVHAYLHRKEGDGPNARYWYGRAGHAAFLGPLDEEWTQIARALLAA